MNFKILNIYFLVLIFSSISFAQNAPKYSNEFLSLGIGARSLAMSGSTIASISDVNSSYWNPAGLNKIKSDMDLGLMHSEYFAGLAKFDYGGLGVKINDSAAIGFSLIRFGVDDIPNTLELIDNDGNIRYDRIKSFSVADYAALFTYSKKSKIQGLRYGVNFKIINRKAGDFAKAWGFGLDAGIQYEYKKWMFGIMGRDITSTFNAWSFNTTELEDVFILTGNEIPVNSTEITLPKLLFGIAREFKASEKISILTEIGFDATFDGKRNTLLKSNFSSLDPHFGFEADFKKLIFLRGGIGNFQEIPTYNAKDEFTFQPNIGIGIKLKRISIDYALTDIGNQSIALYSHVFSLKYAIDKKVIQKDI